MTDLPKTSYPLCNIRLKVAGNVVFEGLYVHVHVCSCIWI